MTTEKKIKWSDIPQIIYANYQVNVSWGYLERMFETMGEGATLEIQPDFQRAHVWNEKQQIRYVEWILRGGRSGRDILWNCPTWQASPKNADHDCMYLVDGLQRITAVRQFLNNKLKVFDKYYYDDFDGKIRLLAGPDFIFHINNLPTRKQVLQWYLDINSGGTIHTKDEIEKVRKLLDDEKIKDIQRDPKTS